MILAYYDGEWVDAQRGAAGRTSCSLGVRNGAEAWASAHGFEHYIYKTFWHKHFPDVTGIRFFPEIRYRGSKVWPWSWHPTATEPILQVFANDIDPDKYFVANPPLTTTDYLRALAADGWSWDLRDGGTKYVHVDDLEKIEGPPPEGAF